MNKKLFYSVAHYFDVSSERSVNKYRNIDKHIEQFLNINIDDKEFILVSAVDAPRGDIYYRVVEEELVEYCKKKIEKYIIHVIVYYNWGGTIAALWMCYNYLKNKAKEGYISHFEEDFGPINNKWLSDSISLLGSDNYIYIGESNIGRIKQSDDDERLSHFIYENATRLGSPEVWTDGGYYFSTMNNLKLIDEKIGCFHKGDQNTKYINLVDGIDIGEVGFPTLLYHNDFKFNVIDRLKYFVNEWND